MFYKVDDLAQSRLSSNVGIQTGSTYPVVPLAVPVGFRFTPELGPEHQPCGVGAKPGNYQ